MQIQPVNMSGASFGKIGKSGSKHFGRNHVYTMQPEPKGQVAKIEAWYENQVNLLCSTEKNQSKLKEQLQELYNEYLRKIDSLTKRNS